MGIPTSPPRIPHTKPPGSDASIMLGIVGAAIIATVAISFVVWLWHGAQT